MAKGDVSVRSWKFAYCYHLQEENFAELCKDIVSKKHQMLCINDTANTINFDEKVAKVKEAFEKLLPKKSSFEK